MGSEKNYGCSDKDCKKSSVSTTTLQQIHTIVSES